MKHCQKCNSLMPEDAMRCIRCGFELQKASVLSAGVQPPATIKVPSTREASVTESCAVVGDKRVLLHRRRQETQEKDIRRYTTLQAPVMAFFSLNFYRDVGLNWKGTGFAYLFLLLAICWIPISIQVHRSLVDFVETKAPTITSQIPTINIIKGEASVEVIQPYKIMNPESGTVIALIDTTGKTASLEGTAARILLTRTEVRYKKNDGTTAGFRFKMVDHLIVNQQSIAHWLRVLRDYGAAFFFLSALIVSFAFRIVQLLVYAAIGLLIAKWCKTSQSYQTLLRLSGMAITPVIIVSTVVQMANITIPFEWVLYFIAAMVYLFLAVKAVSHETNARDGEVDARQAGMKVKALRLAAYLLIAHFLIVAAISFRSSPNYSTLGTLLLLLISSVGVLFSPRRRGWLAVLGYAIVVFGNQALGSWAVLSSPATPLAIKVTALFFLALVDSLAIAALVLVFKPANFAAFAASVPSARET